MKLSELKYDFPIELIATEPVRPTRVMWVDSNGSPEEKSLFDVLNEVSKNDVFVINNTKVLKRRIFTENETEILFLERILYGYFRELFRMVQELLCDGLAKFRSFKR
jgi:S-adenosylmethionine:tRNA ribosyltransferase-isomerase